MLLKTILLHIIYLLRILSMQGRRKTQSKQLVKNVKRVTQIKF